MINEEMLTFYYYGDGLSDLEIADIENQLRTQPILADQYAKLRGELEQMVSREDAGVSDLLVHRLHKSIDRAKDLETSRADRGTRANEVRPVADTVKENAAQFLMNRLVSLAAILVLGLGIGAFFFEGSSPHMYRDPSVNGFVSTRTLHEQSLADTTTPFLRGLQSHLRKTRLELNGDEKTEKPDGLQGNRTLLAIAGQNRMYQKVAELNQASDLARVLRAFEPILMRLAEQELTAEQEQALIAKLRFELDVMLTKLSRAPSKGRYST